MPQKKLQSKEEICERLDELLFTSLQLMSEYVSCREELDKHFKNGYFNMSKARYTMGGKSITPLEYNMNMKAIRRLTFNRDDEHQLLLGVNEEGEEDDEIIRQALKEENIILRERKPNKKEEKKVEEYKDEEKNNKKLEREQLKKKLNRDPINWFGFLTPQSLRQSQRDFITGTEFIVKIANIAKNIQQIENEYQSLLALKSTFV